MIRSLFGAPSWRRLAELTGLGRLDPAERRHRPTCRQQRGAGGGTYAAERQIAFNALKAAGYSDAAAASAVARADGYFMNQLGVDMQTQTRIPGNRAGQ